MNVVFVSLVFAMFFLIRSAMFWFSQINALSLLRKNIFYSLIKT